MKNSFKILVLDDIKSTGSLTKIILENKLGCRVEHCENFKSFHESLKTYKPDLFLLDIELPDGKSFSLVDNLKKDQVTKEIPIIFFSAHTSPENRVKALKIGGSDYLDKPFYPEELIVRVQMHINAYHNKMKLLEELEEHRALVGVLCHDIQNPLSTIYTIADLLIEDNEEPAEEYIPLIFEAAQSGLDLIKHVRNYRRLTNQDVEFAKEVIEVEDAVNEAASLIDQKMKHKKLQLNVEADQEDVSISINRIVFIHNILGNILSNAVKFSLPDSVIKVKIEKITSGNDPLCRITITDKGIGIPEANLKKLFSASENRSREGTNGESGTGFGMPLVKHYMDKSCGQISIETATKEDKNKETGTSVILTFPAHLPS